MSIDTAAATLWDPAQYLKYANARARPALDLLYRVPLTSPGLVYDLGCGAGNVTRLMAQRWPKAQLIGVDSSPEMLEQARSEAAEIQWEEGNIATFSARRPADLIFSNAVLHWLGDHERLIPHLLGQLAPGGVLAIQMPLSWDLPFHRLIRDVLASGGEGGAPLGSPDMREQYGKPPVLEPVAYYSLLAGKARSIDIWTAEYLHVLTGEDPVLEWVLGTALRPILSSLGEDERERFVEVYRDKLRQAYQRREHSDETLLPFRRIFIVAIV